MKRTVTESLKKKIAGRQYFKCANKPMANLRLLNNYMCPLWKVSENTGSFDESGYEIDHIYEFSESGNDSEHNLQALCLSCHRVKTKEFMRNVNKITKNNPEKECIDSEKECIDSEKECIDSEKECIDSEKECIDPEKDVNKILWDMMKDIYDNDADLIEHYTFHISEQ